MHTAQDSPNSHFDSELEKPVGEEAMQQDDTTDTRNRTGRNQATKKTRQKARKNISWRHSTRTRRLVANARERSRIHIMSEAFEGLRRAVPCYSTDQKLSKLAILRLATSYISALANLAEMDSSDQSLDNFAASVDKCTQALQTEGRSKQRMWVWVSSCFLSWFSKHAPLCRCISANQFWPACLRRKLFARGYLWPEIIVRYEMPWYFSWSPFSVLPCQSILYPRRIAK